jgi:hypothetical protein
VSGVSAASRHAGCPVTQGRTLPCELGCHPDTNFIPPINTPSPPVASIQDQQTNLTMILTMILTTASNSPPSSPLSAARPGLLTPPSLVLRLQRPYLDRSWSWLSWTSKSTKEMEYLLGQAREYKESIPILNVPNITGIAYSVFVVERRNRCIDAGQIKGEKRST